MYAKAQRRRLENLRVRGQVCLGNVDGYLQVELQERGERQSRRGSQG